MNYDIGELECPLCHSDKVRSKVCDNRNVWWFICDNWDDPHEVALRGKILSLRDEADARDENDTNHMFYFTEDGRVSLPTGEHCRIAYQETVTDN